MVRSRVVTLSDHESGKGQKVSPMKDEQLVYNPFRMLSPKLDHEIEQIDELHERPVSEEISLEEGLQVMTSKLIEMCRLVSNVWSPVPNHK